MRGYPFLPLLLFAASVDIAGAADVTAKADFNRSLGKTAEACLCADWVQRILGDDRSLGLSRALSCPGMRSTSADESVVVHTLVMGQ